MLEREQMNEEEMRIEMEKEFEEYRLEQMSKELKKVLEVLK